jgi:ABC-type sugar transport system ATPase subunit
MPFPQWIETRIEGGVVEEIACGRRVTVSLTDREAQRLFAMIEQAKSRGVGIVYVTHRMREIRHIGDRVTVLRDGKRVATLDVAEAPAQGSELSAN